MAIRMKCAHCRRTVAVTRRAAGTQVPCPVCRQLLDIPEVTTAICLRENTLAPAAVPAPAVAAEPPLPLPQIAAPIHYGIVGVTAVAAIAALAVLTVAVTASRRPSYREWQATEVFGRPTPAMRLACLDRPLVRETAVEEAPEFTLQTVTAPEADEMAYQPPAPLVINRLNRHDDEELRKQLLSAPELGLYKGQIVRKGISQRGTFREINHRLGSLPLHEIIHTVANRADLAGLPMISARDCQLGIEPASYLEKISTNLRTRMSAVTPLRGEMTETVEDVLREQRRYLTIGKNMREIDYRDTSLPAVMQMLCVKKSDVRLLVTEHLGENDSKAASRALAKMAVFDLSAKVRADALRALTGRPHGEYRQVLLDGLRYPWAPAADHAAEALIVLEDTDALPALKNLATLPDPSAPVYDPQMKKHFVRELVRINHLGNCMLCHAPSKSATDQVRGLIATPGEVLRPPGQYYRPDGSRGRPEDDIFVRADITYLRQDFSVIQPVDNAGPWPSQQRFDYLVRNRPVDAEQAQELTRLTLSRYPQRDAVQHAILQLSSLPPKSRVNDEVTLEARR